MDRKILDRPAYRFDNSAMEKALDDFSASEKSVNDLVSLIDTFRKSDFIVPVMFPKSVGMKTVLKIINGQPLDKRENVPLLPLIMTDPKGNKFAPAFTSVDKITDTKEFPFMIRANAKQIIQTATNEKLGLGGVLINPQTGAFTIRSQAFTEDLTKLKNTPPKPQIKKLSREQFGLFARNTTEKSLIAKELFEKKGAFVRSLEEDREAFLLELYGRPFGDKAPNPYVEDDFDIMALGIDENTTAVCMELPTKNMAPGLALSAYIVYNAATEEVHYYMIEKGQPGEDNVLCNMTPDGKHQELMTAPVTGSELTAVLDLIREEQEENA